MTGVPAGELVDSRGPGHTAQMTAPASRLAKASWALYDCGNSAFSAVIVTFVFATYFSEGIARTSVQGTADWGWAMTVSALAIAVLSPIFGAIADIGGRRKPWLVVFTGLTILGSALLWFAQPHHDFIIYTLVVVILTNIAFEVATVFYNAMLPEIVDESHMGRLSGWGWGLGYFGGLTCLIFALFAFIQAPTPLFGLDQANAEDIRVVGPLVAVWLLVFSIPIVLFTPDKEGAGVPIVQAVRQGLGRLHGTFMNLWDHRQTALFLVARMIYTDGLNTLFAFGGIFAAGAFGMPMAEVIKFGILLNVTAGIGALGFAWVDDWIGAKPTILIALAGLILAGAVAISVEDVTWFWIAGGFLGIFVGPAQAASRSLMGRIAPVEMRGEMFGLYALSGKASAFLGPFVLGTMTYWTDSQRLGMATILAFFVVGGILLALMRHPNLRTA
jgi:UMF1 family MFS transporter